VEWNIGLRKEASLLDVVAGQHGEVRNGEFKVSHSGGLVWEDGAFGEEGRCTRRSRIRRRHFGSRCVVCAMQKQLDKRDFCLFSLSLSMVCVIGGWVKTLQVSLYIGTNQKCLGACILFSSSCTLSHVCVPYFI